MLGFSPWTFSTKRELRTGSMAPTVLVPGTCCVGAVDTRLEFSALATDVTWPVMTVVDESLLLVPLFLAWLGTLEVSAGIEGSLREGLEQLGWKAKRFWHPLPPVSLSPGDWFAVKKTAVMFSVLHYLPSSPPTSAFAREAMTKVLCQNICPLR